MGRGRPSFPRTFSWCVVLELGQQCGLSWPTGLSPAVVRRSSRFGEDTTSLCEKCTSRGAGSQPPVRKAYTLEHVQGLGGSRFARHYSGTCFASSGYMRCFSSPTYLPHKGGSSRSPGMGLPHSEMMGSRPDCGSSIVSLLVCVLRRLVVPRHPPTAHHVLPGHGVLGGRGVPVWAAHDAEWHPGSSIDRWTIQK